MPVGEAYGESWEGLQVDTITNVSDAWAMAEAEGWADDILAEI